MKLLAALLLVLPALAAADVYKHGGSPDPVPHDKYVRVVSEADSPVQQVYVKSKDGAYVAAAIRKPKGDGPFPAIVFFHGAPGGRGMEQLVGWSRGEKGGPVCVPARPSASSHHDAHCVFGQVMAARFA